MDSRPITLDDFPAAFRLWEEAGWAHTRADESHGEMLRCFLEIGRGQVALHDGEPVAQALTCPAQLRHQRDLLDCAVVTAVNTGQRARKRGFAARLTAHMLMVEALDDAQVSVLGMFDQGFYNRLGYGSGPAEHIAYFDPATIRRDFTCRIPNRYTLADFPAMHAGRLQRLACHGQLLIPDPRATRAAMLETHEGFGLGYADGPGGTFSHGFWATMRDAEFGPYDIHLLLYQNVAQFHELMGLLRTFGDQVYTFALMEPPLIQWQDLLTEPFRRRRVSRDSKHTTEPRQFAWWQVRLLDVPAALARTHLSGPPVRFQLQLDDPIAEVLPAEASWRGVGGEYIVTLGEECSADRGADASLPVVKTSVNAFSRLWLGCRSAQELELTDRIAASPELIARIDQALRLPKPALDWAI